MAILRAITTAILTLALCSSCRPLIAAENLPDALSDDEFWQMITSFSEPGGYFSSENFVSNENTYQRVIPALTSTTMTGGVYLGVGPEQNFTYIAALQPRIAFIIDIRRQNILQHLIYKAAFELSGDRADFLSILFSRPRPPSLNAESAAQELLAPYKQAPQDKNVFDANFKALWQVLTEKHGFDLSPEDRERLRHVYLSFFAAGPDISYSFGAGQGVGATPTYAD